MPGLCRRIAVVAFVLVLVSSPVEAGMSLMGVFYQSAPPDKAAPPPDKTYVVQAGDTLWGIAEKLLGTGWAWKALFGANRDVIEDPDLIFPGELIRLPGTPGGPPAQGDPRAATPPPAREPSAAPSGDTAALEKWKGGKLSPSEFSRILGPAARESQRLTGVPASVTLAQAALETGWGAASIGDAKNLFGMKGTGPAGKITVPTQEFINGRMVTIQDGFKKYRTWTQSFADHAELLSKVSRYSKAMQVKNNPDQFAREIHKAGYATDPSYASKLIDIMKANDFYKWDTKETAMIAPFLTVLACLIAIAPVEAAEPELPLNVIATAAWSPTQGLRGTVQKVHDARGIYVRVIDPAGAQLWRSPRLGHEDKQFTLADKPTRLAVADVTGDGSPEIVTAAFHGPDASGLYVFTGAPQPGFTLVRCEHPEQNLSRPFLTSDRPAPEGLDLACLPGGTVKVLGRSFPDDMSGPPVTAFYVYKFRDGAYRLETVEKL